MPTTPKRGLTYLEVGQASKEVTINENYDILDLTPAIVYSNYLVARTASISAITMHAAPASGSLYRFTAYLATTAVGTAGTVLVTLIWDDDATLAITSPSAPVDLATLDRIAIVEIAEVRNAGTIKVSTTVAGATGSPQYMLTVVLEKIN